MQHDPRARPTLAVLVDLKNGWSSPWPRRLIETADWNSLRPLAELPHPILQKAREILGSEPVNDHPRGLIDCSGELRLAEVRSSQWRAGIWTDPDGVRWVVATGLAKGGHEDGDDFYQALAARCATAEGRDQLKPRDIDARILKTETAANMLTRWQLAIQRECLESLRDCPAGATRQRPLPDPVTGKPPIAVLRLAYEIEDGLDCFLVEFLECRRLGSRLHHQLERRVLTSIAPPAPDWDVAGGIYSAMEGSGHRGAQIERLTSADARGELLTTEYGQMAHYAHQRHIGGSLVDGEAIRALCGVFFVATRNPDAFPECPACLTAYQELR